MRAKKGTTNATSTTAPALDILPPATPRFRGRIGNAYVDCEADLIELPTAPAVPQRPFEQQVAGSLTVNVGHPAPGTFYVSYVQRIAGKDWLVLIDIDKSDGYLPASVHNITSPCYPTK